jgi:hypothetical protein
MREERVGEQYLYTSARSHRPPSMNRPTELSAAYPLPPVPVVLAMAQSGQAEPQAEARAVGSGQQQRGRPWRTMPVEQHALLDELVHVRRPHLRVAWVGAVREAHVRVPLKHTAAADTVIERQATARRAQRAQEGQPAWAAWGNRGRSHSRRRASR